MTLSIRRILVCVMVVTALMMCPLAHAGLMYVSDFNRVLWLVDTTSGAAQQVSVTPCAMTDLAMTADGVLFGVDYSSLYRIDVLSGAATAIARLIGSVNALTAAPDGLLYYTGSSGQVYAVDPASGVSHAVGNMGFPSAGDLEFDPAGNLFMSAISGELRMLPAGGGAMKVIGQMGYSDVYGLSFQDGVLFGITSGGKLLTINPQSGATQLLASTQIPAFGATTFFADPLPEPGTIVLMGLGAGALLMQRLGKRPR